MHLSGISLSTAVCPGCGGQFDISVGATHDYLAASAGCWTWFGRALERQFSDYRFAEAHQLFTDAYCLQHSVGEDPRAVRPATVHLAALYAQVELGWSGEHAVLLRKRVSKSASTVAICPPTVRGCNPATVSLSCAKAHKRSVYAYAVSVFSAWSDHHALAARLCDWHGADTRDTTTAKSVKHGKER